MVSPVETAIATSEIKEDSNIIAEGHQDSQYSNWSGAAEGVVANTTDTAMGVIDEILNIPTDVMPALKKAITPRAILNSNFPCATMVTTALDDLLTFNYDRCICSRHRSPLISPHKINLNVRG